MTVGEGVTTKDEDSCVDNGNEDDENEDWDVMFMSGVGMEEENDDDDDDDDDDEDDEEEEDDGI